MGWLSFTFAAQSYLRAFIAMEGHVNYSPSKVQLTISLATLFVAPLSALVSVVLFMFAAWNAQDVMRSDNWPHRIFEGLRFLGAG